ncbi:hypothetical protein K0M31_003830 [Melipona bicolor]|uniref:Uncharacterized protein n=1 Tax=Melipona bicolor TaxID=60889 RepID=A0AA40FY31_9HYME|nr:hypothetical protein K0M31_003830 [Melipona bicolor]
MPLQDFTILGIVGRAIYRPDLFLVYHEIARTAKKHQSVLINCVALNAARLCCLNLVAELKGLINVKMAHRGFLEIHLNSESGAALPT